jgi:N6-adenosine-specific RNA methylase IME4
MATPTTTGPPDDGARAAWAERITTAWRKGVEAIIESGRLLLDAKADPSLPHGDFLDMIERDLPFGARTAQMLMKIGADPRLANANHASLLPPHWTTLYELTKLTDEQFEAKVAAGEIHPELERRDVVMADSRERRARREIELGAFQTALPLRRYGVIYADPPWRWEAWSRVTGLDYSPESHYPTMDLDAVKALDAASIAADDSVLFLWATRPHLANALGVIAAWGFTYKTCFGWTKTEADGSLRRRGIGYWAVDNLELLLLGTKGEPPCPAQGDQWLASIPAPVGRHSEKPEVFYRLIESYFPTLPKIELFARAARPGWDRWGLEAPAEPEAAE